MLAVLSIVSLPSLIKSLAIPPCLLVTLRTAQALGGLCGERDVGTSTSQAREIAPMWERACRQPRSAKQEISGNEPELAGHANIA
jgi:hypothetical protein